MTLSEFGAHCQIPDLEDTFSSFMDLLGRADSSPSRECLTTLLAEGTHGWLSMEEWSERYGESFQAFAAATGGALDMDGLQAALREWGYELKNKMLEMLFYLVDREPYREKLTAHDVYMGMCALVGVRGSISSKVPGGQGQARSSPMHGRTSIEANAKGISKLMEAANAGDALLIRDLDARGADVNSQDEYGWTALRYAVRRKSVAAVKELIDLGADVNLSSQSGQTPLMFAVAAEAENVVQLLVDSQADLTAAFHGVTAYELASRGGAMSSSIIRNLVDPNFNEMHHKTQVDTEKYSEEAAD